MLDNYQPHIQSFIDYLRFEKRYSQHTILSYRNDLEQFFSFLSSAFDAPGIAQVTAGMIRTWLASLKEEKYSAKSIHRKISSLRSFFKVQLREDVIQLSPLTTIVAPKAGKRLPVFVTKEEMDTLFQHVAFTDDWKGKTDRLILSVFYQTGMRVSELVNLKESHVDGHYRQLKVVGKGNKERLIPLSQQLLKEMQDYMAEKPAKEEHARQLFFVNEKGRPLTRAYVYQAVKSKLSEVTTVEKKSPHVLRHTFATHLTNSGADLNAVKELLGHASLAATQVYTHNTIDKLKEVFRRAHPKA